MQNSNSMFDHLDTAPASGIVGWLINFITLLVSGVVGWFVYQNDGRIKETRESVTKLETRVDAHYETNKRDRHTLRNELAGALDRETTQRMTADRDVEDRMRAHFDRLIDTMNANSKEIRADVRELRSIVIGKEK